VAIFGRNSARQRLRRAAEESLKFSAFSTTVDCTPWVTGGLWPAELSTVTAHTAPLVKHLKADLQRIVDAANEELQGIRRAGLSEGERQSKEDGVISDARAFAVKRVESTVRHLHDTATRSVPLKADDDGSRVTRAPRFRIAAPHSEPAGTAEVSTATPDVSSAEEIDVPAPPTRAVAPERFVVEPEPLVDEPGVAETAADRVEPQRPVVEREPREPDVADPDTADTTRFASPGSFDADATEVLEQLARLMEEFAEDSAALPDPRPSDPRREERSAAPPPASIVERDTPAPIIPPVEPVEPETTRLPIASPPPVEPETTRLPVVPPPPLEPEPVRLHRLLMFVARQEPGLRWAIGVGDDDGATVLATDLAHGWIPPNIALPAEVVLLEPGRRGGSVAALLGATTVSAMYQPGDPLGSAASDTGTPTSARPRAVSAIEDLGWRLSEATHWRDGLPPLVNTLARAGAAGTGVVDAEIATLRLHLDTARYQVLAQYPHVEVGVLLNCLLLAATEGLATRNRVEANYHFAWFQVLSDPPDGY
jgi:hypothetical protein